MEAKDTVMTIPQLQHLWGNENWQYITSIMTDFFGEVAKAQAEISFNAGAKEGYGCGVYNGKADGIAEGIKEVVDWMAENITWDWPNDELLFSSWLKERGL